MYFDEKNGKHHIPHIHVRYNNYKIIYDFESNILSGEMPYKQKKNIMQDGKEFFKIDPLK